MAEENYKIFLSFSGKKSKKFANELKKIIEKLELGKVFFSEDNIKTKDDWLEQINQALNTSRIGIICVTKENWNRPWLFLEYGALLHKRYIEKKNSEKNNNNKTENLVHVFPLFLDFIKKEWRENPIDQINGTSFVDIEKDKSIKDVIKNIIIEINQSSYDEIEKEKFEEKFDSHKDFINEKVKKIEKILKKNYENKEKKDSSKKRNRIYANISSKDFKLLIDLYEIIYDENIPFSVIPVTMKMDLLKLFNSKLHLIEIKLYPQKKDYIEHIRITKKGLNL